MSKPMVEKYEQMLAQDPSSTVFVELARAAWLLHWDAQVAKVLEASYRGGLERLTEALPPIKAELIVTAAAPGGVGGAPALRPPVTELRAAYYGALRRYVHVTFLGLPAAAGGLPAAAGEWISVADSRVAPAGVVGGAA